MDSEKLTAFFLWCSIINGALLIFSIILLIAVPDFVYTMHGKLFSLPREAFNGIVYWFLGIYKIFFLTFNLVPYVALRIIRKS